MAMIMYYFFEKYQDPTLWPVYPKWILTNLYGFVEASVSWYGVSTKIT